MTMNEFMIISECYADTNLIETLSPPTKGYNHQKGCNNVMKLMKEKFSNTFAVGIIDQDKRQASYLSEFEEIASTGSLYLYRHTQKPHYIIQLSPALESFVLNCLKETDIPADDYPFSSELETLRNKTKNISSKKDPILRSLFKAIQNTHDCIVLKGWIEHLKTQTYSASAEILAGFTNNHSGKS